MDSSSGDDDVPIAVPLEEASVPSSGPGEPNAASGEGKHVPVPVTLITGFLGAGKSTLVRHILTAQHGRRIAVIVNEFGDELGIERAIVNEHEGDRKPAEVSEWLELANGCLCCSVKGQLVSGLENLLRQRHRFDYILIETSGLANPGPVASALWTDPELEAGVALDGIVTVADARNLRQQLAAPPALHTGGKSGGESGNGTNEAQQQLAYSDVVLLNKVDLEDDVALSAVEGAIAAVNPTAVIVRTRHSAVDLAAILDIRAMAGLRELDAHASTQFQPHTDTAAARLASLNLKPRQQSQAQQQQPPQQQQGGRPPQQSTPPGNDASRVPDSVLPPPCGGASEAVDVAPHLEHQHQLSGADSSVTSVSLRIRQPLDIDRVRQWVEALLWERQSGGPDIFRIKGVLCVAASPRQHLLQGVCELYDITEGATWSTADVDAGSRVVVIGARLPPAADLENALLRCAADD